MTESPDGAAIGDDELARFAEAFTTLAQEAHRLARGSKAFADLVEAHLGVDPSELPVVIDNLDPVERPNLQLALDVVAGRHDGTTVVGLPPELRHYHDFSIASMLSGTFRGPSEPVPPSFDALPVDVDRTLPCVIAGVWLLWHQDVPVVVGAFPSETRGPASATHRLEIFAADRAVAEAVSGELTALRRELNVYRGKVLSFTFSEYGVFGIAFMARPTTGAGEIVLPEGDLASIERHTIGIGKRADHLRARGQHLKRGLLLYGPPGTGKTHTVGYLMAAMPERTTIVLQGPGVGALGQAAAIARAFPPAMLIIEDVDLVANERYVPGMGGSNPLLFQLLNEMDGLAATDDVLFVLTTNRLDVLEPALAARPGRVDHAVEIDRPDPNGRDQLLRLYLGHEAAASLGDLSGVVARTEGVTASFFKELVRRATYLAIEDDDAALTAAHLSAALDELLEHAAPVMRTLLGIDDLTQIRSGTRDYRGPDS